MRSLKAQHKKPRWQNRQNVRFSPLIPGGITLQSHRICPRKSRENKEEMIINIIYKSDHCIAGILYLSDHPLAFFGVHRCSLDDQLHAYCFGGLYLCITYPISGFCVRLRSKALISIISELLFVSWVFILIGVSGIIIRIISSYC